MAIFDITNCCNMACEYCNRYMSEQKEGLQEPTYEEIIKIFKDICKTPILQLAIQGGEPLLRKDLYQVIEEMSEIKCVEPMNVKDSWKSLAAKQLIKNNYFLHSYINMKRIKFPIISVTTNGTIYNSDLHQLFFKKNIHLEVSLDTVIPELHNRKRSAGRETFTMVSQNIREYAQNVPVVIKSTVDEDNVNQMIELIYFAHKLDCVQVIFHPIKFVGKALDHISKLHWIDKFVHQVKEIIELGTQKRLPILVEIILPVNFLKNEKEYLQMRRSVNMTANLVLNFHSCIANQTIEEIYITPNLDVYGCPQLLHMKEMKIGNLREVSILEIESLEKYKELQYTVKNRKNIKHCVNCAIASFCKGGCVAAGYVNEKNVYGKDWMCQCEGV